MGIESEQLVYDYLSRVGDLAGASPALTASDRARLVTTLRQTIDAQQAAAAPRSARAEVGSVRKILAGLGTPDEVVHRAAVGGLPSSGPEVPRRASSVPSQGNAPVIEGRAEFVRADAGDPLGPGATYATDWWSLGGGGAPGAGTGLGGGYGGDLPALQPPGWSGAFADEFLRPDRTGLVDPVTGIPTPRQLPPEPTPVAAPVPKRGLLRRVLTPAPAAPPAAPAPAAVRRGPIPLVEGLATLVLVAAVVTGLWYVALLGWLFAYAGRRFGRGFGRFVALWVPGLIAVACGFWLYSRAGHAPNHPGLSSAQMTTATHNAFAFWLRGSAGVSAALLTWRITRR